MRIKDRETRLTLQEHDDDDGDGDGDGDDDIKVFCSPNIVRVMGDNNNNNNIYLLHLGCHPVAVVILHVNKTRNWLLLNLSQEGYMRSM